MSKLGLTVLSALVAISLPVAVFAGEDFYKPVKFSGAYEVYSGMLGDWGPPTKKDAKVAIEVDGRLANDMFKHLDHRLADPGCLGEDVEIKEKGDLTCTRDKKSGKTTCYFGLDLKSGKLINGVIC